MIHIYIYIYIKNFNHTHSKKLHNKLSHLLAESKWEHIGHPEMVLNLKEFPFSTTEIEARSFGLKFVTGIHQNMYIYMYIYIYI